ncbi:MAG: UbiA family prenyltransferase [Methanomicrobia archaeon]|nr:UbiA family prenyltransferase [Methanomicrobia archaeon]
MNKKKLIAYIRLERPQYSVIVFLVACAGMIAAHKGVPDIISLLGVGFIFWIILNTAHPVNDYFDREIDKIARPDAPLPSGDLSPEEAKKSVMLHYILVPLLVILIASVLSVETVPLMTIAFFGLVLTAIYSIPPIRMRKRGILKDITVGLAPSTAFLGGWVAIKGWSVSIEFLVLVSVYFLLLVCSQMLADIHDMKGEKTVGWKTLPVTIGVRNTLNLSLFLGILAALFISLPIFNGWFNRYYTILGGFIIFWIVFVYVKCLVNFDPEKGREWNEKLLIGVMLYSIAIIIGSV